MVMRSPALVGIERILHFCLYKKIKEVVAGFSLKKRELIADLFYRLAVKRKKNGLQGFMNKNKKYHCGLLVTAVIALFSLTSVSAYDNFVKISLPKGVSIELPKDWVIQSNTQRNALEAVADSVLDLTGTEYGNDFKFAANYYRNNRLVSVAHINYYPDRDLTQNNARQATPQAINDMDTSLKEGVVPVLKDMGIPILSWEGTRKITLNGIAAFVTEYHRKIKDDLGVSCVRIIKIYAGERSFNLTVSYLEEEQSFLKPITDRIINSLKLSGISDASVDEEKDSVFDVNTARPVNDSHSSVDNSQVYTKPTSSNTDSLMSHLYGVGKIMLVLLALGLTPPLLIRFLIVRRPIGRWWAIGAAVGFFIINIFLFAILEVSLRGTLLIIQAYPASIIVAAVSYFILRKTPKQKANPKKEAC